MIPTELQPIIFAAGKGSRISELCLSCPKCLLTIGNKPMIYYTLEMLQKAKFRDVIIIVSDIHEELISKAINELKMEIITELIAIPFKYDYGTADSLRYVKDKVKKDMLLLSCDTITDFPLNRIIEMYRIYDPTVIALVSAMPFSNESIPGRKGRDKCEKDIIGIDKTNSNRLVFLSSEADFDDTVTFKMSMLKKCSQFEIYSNYVDSHIYILKKWVLKYLEEKSNISSIKGELIPSFVRKQFRKEFQLNSKTPHTSASIISSVPQKRVFDFIEVSELETELLKLQPIDIDVSEDIKYDELKKRLPNYYPKSKIKCYTCVINEGYCMRANTLLGYWGLNQLMLKNHTPLDKRVSSQGGSSPGISSPGINSAQFDQLREGSNRSIIGNVKSIGEKTTIKRSIIGNNCKIGNSVKLTNSVVMDDVTIGNGCNIQGTIICSKIHIENSAEIKDCIVASNVASYGKHINEVIMDIDQMMEL